MNEDKIIGMLLDHEDRLIRIEENMATKADLRGIQVTMDEILKLTRKKDQELVFMSEHVKRIDRDVQKIKPLVGLA